MVKSKGASFVDAPVSGGVIGAENGTLTFMVGGSETEYNTVKPVLECMGQRITHCGDYGMGQAAKLCNNMMLGISMIGVCETMNLAIRFVFRFGWFGTAIGQNSDLQFCCKYNSDQNLEQPS